MKKLLLIISLLFIVESVYVVAQTNSDIGGVYVTQSESYRLKEGQRVTYGANFEISITYNDDGSYYVDDLLGGWYSQRSGYGPDYAMTGEITIKNDGTISLQESFVKGWGDSLDNLTGKYDAATSTFTIDVEYAGMQFNQIWIKDNKVITVDGKNYRIDNGTLTIVKGDYTGDFMIPNDVSYNGINYAVTTIDEEAFSGCTGLTSVIIPNSVTSIEGTFKGCTGLTSVIIPNSVTSIAKAFNGCTSLTSVDIPNSVKSVGGAFIGCTGLTSVKLPNELTIIGDNAFTQCRNIKDIIIPNSVTTIEPMAFFECEKLNTLTLSNNLTSIGQDCFNYCFGLKSIYIPKSVINIEEDALTCCGAMESIIVEDRNSNYDSRDNCNAIIETNTNKLLLGCKKTVIPQNITIIGPHAFACCHELNVLKIPNSVKMIENGAFWDCTSLKDIIIGNNVEIIDNGAFQECSSLQSVVVPSTTKQIGYWTFSYCPKLKDFYIYADAIPTTHTDAFWETPIENAILHVPASSLEAYKQSVPWSSFGKIVALTGDDPKPTNINSLIIDDGAFPVESFNLDGRRISQPQRGINIIRGKSGKTKKVFLK